MVPARYRFLSCSGKCSIAYRNAVLGVGLCAQLAAEGA
jgi:hypothetical protein